MIVYCDVYDCLNNIDGVCTNKWPHGSEAIKISENWMGIPSCTDFKDVNEEDKPT